MSKLDPRVKYDYALIHTAIHNRELREVELSDGKKLPIGTLGGMRKVGYDGINFIEQNPNKNSGFAKLAREGAHITWGIVLDSPWIYLDDIIAQKIKDRHEAIVAALKPSNLNHSI